MLTKNCARISHGKDFTDNIIIKEMFNYLTTKHGIGEITYALVRITTFGKE